MANLPILIKHNNNMGAPWLIVCKMAQLGACICGIRDNGWQYHKNFQQMLVIARKGSWSTMKPLKLAGEDRTVTACEWLKVQKDAELERRQRRKDKNTSKRERGAHTANMTAWALKEEVHAGRLQRTQEMAAEDV